MQGYPRLLLREASSKPYRSFFYIRRSLAGAMLFTVNPEGVTEITVSEIFCL